MTKRISGPWRGALLLTAAALFVVLAGAQASGQEPGDAPRPGAAASAEAVPGELIVGFAPSAAGAESRTATISAAGAEVKRHLLVPGYTLVEVPAGEEAAYTERLLDISGVASVEPNLVRRALFEPNDPLYPNQWHFPKIGLTAAWDKTMGEGVTVAVIDGGVAYENCSLLTCGAQYFKAPDFGGTTFVSPYDFVDDDSHANDEDGHGTHVASTIAEATNNSIGGAGVAPDASIMPVRVCDSDSCPVDALLDGIAWAADNGADIINMSLGATGPLQSERDAVDYALDNHVVVIAAAGNGGDDGIGDPELDCPACYPGVIAVGATRIDQSLAPYSNYGAGVDGQTLSLVAPGGDSPDSVYQQTFTHYCLGTPVDYAAFSICPSDGTSMASPHVAGVAALVLSVNPDLTPAEVSDILTSTATDLGASGYDSFFGHGQVNAAAAVAAAQGGGPPPATPTPPTTEPPDFPDKGTMVASGTPGVVGGAAKATLRAEDFPAPGFGAWTVDIGYDSDILDAELCSALLGGVCNPAFADGAVRVSGATLTGITGDALLASITFRCLAAGTSPLLVHVRILEEVSAVPAPMSSFVAHGSISCAETALGDVNCDDVVDATDALWILWLDSDIAPFLPCPEAADVNGDGRVDAVDALWVLWIQANLL